MVDIGASILPRLKNKAKASGISYQECLQLFFQEEFLGRLSKSAYSENLMLKGGLLIYTLTNFESRATIHIDFLLRHTSNALVDTERMINEIIGTPTGYGYIEMWAHGFEEISPQRKYRGISGQIIGRIKWCGYGADTPVFGAGVPRYHERSRISTQMGLADPEVVVSMG